MKIISSLVGIFLATLIVAPVIDYTVPLYVNGFTWCWLVSFTGMLGLVSVTKDIPLTLKMLSIYLFANCFISQSPYLSFNAYMLVTFSFWLFILVQKCKFNEVTGYIEAAFWFELILVLFQLLGKDTLMNFGRHDSVFLGSLMQYMRFSSLVALMSVFLILKNKWYCVPVFILCVLSRSMGLALSLVVGTVVYLIRYRKTIWARTAFLAVIIFTLIYSAYDWGSIRGAILPENGGRIISWINAIQTWFMDTSKDTTFPMLEGPLNLKWIFFGHGMDTFLPLFPIYKHDSNPFPQAHNDWLQFGWEIGLVGLGLVVTYVVSLIRRLYQKGLYGYVAGLACIGTSMTLNFLTRMTQSMFLLVVYVAFCEQKIKEKVS